MRRFVESCLRQWTKVDGATGAGELNVVEGANLQFFQVSSPGVGHICGTISKERTWISMEWHENMWNTTECGWVQKSMLALCRIMHDSFLTSHTSILQYAVN